MLRQPSGTQCGGQVQVDILPGGDAGKFFEFSLKMCLIGIAQKGDEVGVILVRRFLYLLERGPEADDPAVMLRSEAHMAQKQPVNMALRIIEGERQLFHGCGAV